MHSERQGRNILSIRVHASLPSSLRSNLSFFNPLFIVSIVCTCMSSKFPSVLLCVCVCFFLGLFSMFIFLSSFLRFHSPHWILGLDGPSLGLFSWFFEFRMTINGYLKPLLARGVGAWAARAGTKKTTPAYTRQRTRLLTVA